MSSSAWTMRERCLALNVEGQQCVMADGHAGDHVVAIALDAVHQAPAPPPPPVTPPVLAPGGSPAWGQTARTAAPKITTAPNRSLFKRSNVAPLVALFACLLAVAWWTGKDRAFNASTPPNAHTLAPAAEFWQPSGYQLADDEPSVAWRWMEKGEFDCRYGGSGCWGIEAIARYGCPNSLYVELSLLDSAGTAIGYTNDAIGAVAPQQHAKLLFDTFEDGAQKARITQVSCN
jgi:hypothetical protein